MRDTITVQVRRLDERDAGQLLCVYPRQQSPQPCYVALDLRTGQVWADYDGEIGGGVPLAVAQGLTRRYSIPPLQAADANALLEELRPLLQRVADGSEVVWDGNRYVGRLTADAAAAEAEIERLIEAFNGGLVHWVMAQDWFLGGVDDELAARLRSDEPIDAIAADVDGDGTDEDTPRIVDLFPWLERQRERLQAEAQS